MNYEEWLKSMPAEIREDSLWRMEAYRLALFVADVSWHDVTKLVQDKRTVGLSGQLYEALGSISANLSEEYSRGTGRDRARFYEYALGSAREARGWYYKGRHVLGAAVAEHRIRLLTQIIRLVLTMVPSQRGSCLREESTSYGAKATEPNPETCFEPNDLSALLESVPLSR
jgi:four helix bundle protein